MSSEAARKETSLNKWVGYEVERVHVEEQVLIGSFYWVCFVFPFQNLSVGHIHFPIFCLCPIFNSKLCMLLN